MVDGRAQLERAFHRGQLGKAGAVALTTAAGREGEGADGQFRAEQSRAGRHGGQRQPEPKHGLSLKSQG